jgi:hypothetical protein
VFTNFTFKLLKIIFTDRPKAGPANLWFVGNVLPVETFEIRKLCSFLSPATARENNEEIPPLPSKLDCNFKFFNFFFGDDILCDIQIWN